MSSIFSSGKASTFRSLDGSDASFETGATASRCCPFAAEAAGKSALSFDFRTTRQELEQHRDRAVCEALWALKRGSWRRWTKKTLKAGAEAQMMARWASMSVKAWLLSG
ncbi:MAG: hypothetical protein AUG51_00020 [Acidobacteria bacterium 13_1_20CM_3_53_8]|nr:MAG: hypothetical protein AUG51_00020 [Acidobacteria bacterium 13_1_20CM_3_53_8]